jgi:N-acetylmuramoyl-L-alanine amidase
LLQYRVPPGKAAPTFVVLEPLRSAPPPASDGPRAEDGVGQVAQGVTTISTPIGSLQVYGREDWGGRAPKCSTATTTSRATIHHTVTPTKDSLTPQARLRQIQSYHMDVQGWCDIGYNYLVSRDGRMWRGRGVGVLGSHVGDNNSGNVGISFMGTHTSTTATATQLCSAAKLLAVLHDEHPALSLSSADIKGHRQYGGTECPGTALFNQIDDIIRKAARGCGTP